MMFGREAVVGVELWRNQAFCFGRQQESELRTGGVDKIFSTKCKPNRVGAWMRQYK